MKNEKKIWSHEFDLMKKWILISWNSTSWPWVQKNLTIIMYCFPTFVAKHIVDVRKVGHNLESHNTKMNLWKTQSQGHPQLSRIKEKTNGPSKFWLVRFITMALCFLSICPFIIFTFSSITLSVNLPSFDYKLNCQL